MPHQLPRNWQHARPNLFLPFPRSASSSSWSGTSTENCANFPSSVLPAFQRERICKEHLQKTVAAERLVHDSPKTTNKPRDNQPTANHAISFTRRPVCLTKGYVNCQGAITSPTANRVMTPIEPSAVFPASGGTVQLAEGSHKGKTSKTGPSGLENSKSETSSETQESAQTCPTDNSWIHDGWNPDEWKDG